MSESIRIVKFETKIEEIRHSINGDRLVGIADGLFRTTNTLVSAVTSAAAEIISGSAEITSATVNRLTSDTAVSSLIFNDPLNSYAEIVKKNFIIRLKDDEEESTRDPWREKYKNSSFKDLKVRINAAKDFVRYCNMPINRKEAYKFIFWSLMILTVDDWEKEKHLSIICDFARMLHISDEAMEDLVTVIKILYGEARGKKLKTDIVKEIFSRVIEAYQ